MIPTSSMPHGYPGAIQQTDPRMLLAYRGGFNLSPYSNVRGRRLSPYQQGLNGSQLQQQFAYQNMFQPQMGAGLNLASFLTKLAYSGGMR